MRRVLLFFCLVDIPTFSIEDSGLFYAISPNRNSVLSVKSLGRLKQALPTYNGSLWSEEWVINYTPRNGYHSAILARRETKSDHRTFVHFTIWPFARVILSGAKNLSERPFVSLRVTHSVCQSFLVRFRVRSVL